MTAFAQGRLFTRGLRALGVALLLMLASTLGWAQTAAGGNFDHLRTGFALSGAHNQVKCESCHLGGVLKGTPRDCASCHLSGQRFARGNIVMPLSHVPTTQACDTCHSTKGFAGVRFSHNNVQPGTCQSCHNGSNAGGKTANHVATSASCDACHRSGAWLPLSGFDHASVSPGSCGTCHNGTRSTGKSAQHVPTGAAACDSCHKSFSAWRPTVWNHTQVPVAAQCATCHSGGFPPASGKPANHPAYQNVAASASANCDACHKGSTTTWANGRFHANVAVNTGCATCHGGGVLASTAKPSTPIHNGVTNCESCHTGTATWAGAKVDHSTYGAATNCANCHNGNTTTGKSATHIPVGPTNCFTCHATNTWKPSKWTHTQLPVAGQCTSCHSGAYPPADGKNASHIPYTSVAATASANCDTCHKSGFGAWAPAKFHSNVVVTASCATCHTGGFAPAVGKPNTAIHAGVTGNCESCHKTTSTWSGAKVDHSGYSASTNCASCHNGAAASGKSTAHVPVGGTNCFSCHSVSAWTPAKWNHTQLAVAGQCASCHTGGYPPADGRSPNHIPFQSVAATASANCDTCHKSGFGAWAPAKFHNSVTVSTNCATCHTGAFPPAVGKPSTAIHATVTGNCESCHKSSSSWQTAKVDHSSYNASTNCANCHNGAAATGKSATHVPVAATNCFSCHSTNGWTPTKWNHTQVAVAGQCASCHTGGYPPADGRSPNHIPFQSVAAAASANCDACHKGGFTAWAPAKFHASISVSTGCVACHSGAFPPAVGKPSSPIHAGVTGNCESCHKSTSTWAAKVDHTGFNASTNCASCHNGATATGKSGTHIPVGSANCVTCHNVTGWVPSKWNHTQLAVAGQCASCHTGGYPPADGKNANHIPYGSVAAAASANCDTCHKTGFGAWAPAKFHSSVNVTSGCATCHTGAFAPAVGKANTPIHATVTGNCESCHKTTSTWSGAKADHSGFTTATVCTSCHNGASATGKSATHVPVGSTNCITCHSTSGWSPTKWNHTQVAVAGQCASCHSGGYPPADGKSPNHIPYQSVAVTASANCDSCHKGGFAAWAPARLHSSVVVTANCVACHSGGFPPAVGKPGTAIHASVTGNCESCHKSTSTWAGAKVDHSGFNASTNCAGCHDGSSATGKSATHSPVGSANCFSCHNTSGWTPTKWNHTQVTVTAQCATCHTGGYPPADGKPGNHIPYQTVAASSSANCDACHKGSFSTWANGRFHSNYSVSTGCFSCHTGGFMSAVGKPSTAIHATVTGNCESCHKSTTTWSGAKVDHSSFNTATNCASCHDGSSATGKSATHAPVGSTSCFSCHNTSGWTPTKWNHTQVPVTAQCATCHTGGYPPADGKPGNHIPYASVGVSAGANCDSCHKGSFSSWTNGRFHSNYTLATGCFSCHTGSYLNAVGKPGTVIHATVTGNCESCHKSTSTWSGAKVDHSSFNAATNCATCHDGSSATGKPATHAPVGATGCFNCHNVTGWTPTKWNHTQVTVTAQCATCHTGGYPPADGKPGNHIPYQAVAVSSSANCDACHKGSFSSWTNGRFHSNYTVSSGCFSCHTGSYLNAVGKPGTAIHATVTGNCESCHKSTSTWSGAKVDHSSFNAATNCATCHDGSSATGKPATHAPVGATGCFNCHNVTGWTPTKWNHTQVTVTAQCATCHTGGYPPADGKPGNHIPYASVGVSAGANCDACHKGSFTTWANGRFHSNYTVSTGCFSCHTGSYLSAVGKPGTAIHATVTGNCESCHKSTTTWAGAKVDHTGFNASTNCASCHTGGSATGKPATHSPVGATNCFSCHNVTGWTPTKWNHTQVTVTAQCATCHTGGYPPADGKPGNHIPYATVAVSAAANCDACHKGSFSSWTNGRFHSNYSVSTGCFSCHTGSYLNAVGKPGTAIHATVTGNCESCHKSTSTWSGAKVDHSSFNAATNCATCHDGSSATGKPATHAPVGATGCFNCHNVTGWTPTKWNHTQVTVTAQCATCHTGGYPPADGKPGNHIPYASVGVSAGANCDACHKGSFSSWANGRFHSNYTVSTGCFSCHTGSYLSAVGKPGTAIHATVTGNCESCHKSTTTWAGAKVDHSGFNATTNCGSCHNGSSATGKSATHSPVGATNCFSCHSVTGWTPTKWNHTQVTVTAQCATCHTGGYPPADGKPGNHIPYATVAVSAAANCDACHKGSFTNWANGRFHSNYTVSTGCFSCHTGSYLNAVGKPGTAIHATVTGNCESCHKSTTTWSGAKVDHSGFNATTNCASCHDGSSATGKPGTHAPVGATGCFSCHNVTGWTPTKWNHTQVPVTAQCATCHTGGYPPADGKPGNHIPYATVAVSAAANCDACHKGSFTTWANGRFHSNYTVSTGCFSCHTGSYLSAVGKPGTTIHATVTGNCESCHKSTTTWAGAKVDHSSFNAATNCATCHDGSSATGKPATHAPVGATGCFSCHNVTGWTPTKWNHTQVPVTAQCATCHTGGYPPADGKPGNHIPYATVAVSASANCDACHKGSFTNWANGRFHSYYTVATGCFSCHTGSYLSAAGKPGTAIHATVTGNCESCHKSTTTWAGAKVDHSGFNATTTCATCHNGSSATGKSATHAPVGATNCFSCHNVTGWTPTKWNHTQVTVTAQCATCHTGGYPPADGKPGNHIPYATVAVSAAANCDACHKGSFTNWANGRFHSYYTVATGCFSCHTGSYLNAVGKPSTAIHATVTGNCESCHKSTTTWAGAKVDHSGFNATTNCATCHNGSSATGKSATHSPVGATNCFSCHNVTGWTPTKWNHTQVVVTAQCATCHTGGYPPADGKPGNHIPYATVAVTAAANCDACHKGSFSTWANGRLHSSFSIASGCVSCHTGAYLSAVGKPGNAIHSTITGNCESCHKSTTSWSSVSYTHAPANAVGTGTCDTCHNGSTATGKPGTHIPIPAGAAKCDSCHRSQAAWKTSMTMNHSVVTAGACKSCHNGSYVSAGPTGALAKPSNHIPEVQLLGGASMDCNACHTSTTAWSSQRMNHNASQGNGAGWCKACHQSGTSYMGSMERKSLTHQKSTGVTDCSQSGCHRPLGNKGAAYTKWD